LVDLMEMQKNVLGSDLQDCSTNPMTGFYRDGCCNTGLGDTGTHTVCAIMTEEFLEYSLNKGNDLITSRPEFGFPGLKAGDGWCLCALRWEEARKAGCAPRVKLISTNIKTLEMVEFEDLKTHQIDLN
jgi:uncharacterized protein (DUF2237 family)